MARHTDCRNYIPVDVQLGICNRLKTQVPASMEACPQMELLPKCANCKNFSNVNDRNIGDCNGFKEPYWSYADLRAIKCDGYAKA
jgi:4-hydroxyphenylacetate decarboxylase small subunit